MSEDLGIALAKFNRMYNRVTVEERTIAELSTVTNYGINMLKLFSDFFENEVEAPDRVRALERSLMKRINLNIK